ncbi:MAG TPA: hypothetical protein VFO94_15570, partial [Gammaproteobacteria bacterium]|nr:hypothetical protein [Gammaproteobacteria bacterium]
MPRRSTLKFTLCALALFAACGASAQEKAEHATSNMDILRDKLAADKRLIVAENLMLTEGQAKAFWPMYDEYQKAVTALNERTSKLIAAYADAYNRGPVSDSSARKLLDEAIAIDEAEVALRKTYASKLIGVVPTIEAARYLQIENKIRAVVNYDL